MVGLGRVGLPLALLAARAGQRVVGAERDPEVRAIARGQRPSAEPGLTALALEMAASGRFLVTEQPCPARTSVVCVGTPLGPDRRADLSDLEAALAQLDATAPEDGLVVLSSTVPPGTTERAAERLRARAPARLVACCPERVLPGDALREIVENPRLAGGVDRASTAAARRWLAQFVTGPILEVDSRMAEVAKLAENAARDVELALAHTLAEIARSHGLDPHELRSVVNQHPRVKLLVPGVGVGGHCLPIDPWFLVQSASEAARLLTVAREINDEVPSRWIERISAEASRTGARIGLLGLAYKPDTDDLRESPALRVARALSQRFDVLAHEPFLDPPRPPLSSEKLGVRLGSLQEVLERELVVLLVAHRAYRGLSGYVRGSILDPGGGWR